MPLTIKDLDWLKSFAPKESPEFGQKMSEIINQVLGAVNTMEQQTNSNVNGNPVTPPAPNAVHVVAQNGHFSIGITDQDPSLYRGVSYYIDHSTSPQFTNPITEHLGPSRNTSLFLGSGTRYFRAYKSYQSSPPSAPVYHGSASAPTAVAGGGTIGPPAAIRSQGSGTGAQGEGLQGPGTLPYRGSSTKAPIR